MSASLVPVVDVGRVVVVCSWFGVCGRGTTTGQTGLCRFVVCVCVYSFGVGGIASLAFAGTVFVGVG